MVTARTICAKTSKGQEEIERRTNRLSPRLRQMLILMDGRRDTEALQSVFPPELVPALVQQLIDGGFVAELNPLPAAVVPALSIAPAPGHNAPTNAPSPGLAKPLEGAQGNLGTAGRFLASAPAPLSGFAAGEEDPFTLGQTFMINLAKRILGVAGDGIIAKLKVTQDVDGLRALYLEWRNTIKQAPDGLLRLRELEKKLSKVLGDLPSS